MSPNKIKREKNRNLYSLYLCPVSANCSKF